MYKYTVHENMVCTDRVSCTNRTNSGCLDVSRTYLYVMKFLNVQVITDNIHFTFVTRSYVLQRVIS
jgi:hypothetical protein